MFNKEEVARVVDLQARSYALLQWTASAVSQGKLSFKVAHASGSTALAAQEWLERNLLDLPEAVRPSPGDIEDFSGLFSTYLESTFELVPQPGQRLYSPRAHCFCKMCSWLVDVPNLQPKRPSPPDKKRARKLMAHVVERLAAECGLTLSGQAVQALENDEGLREQLALCAYATDLFTRMQGQSIGPAALVLWRTFAWLPTGSPKKKFQLTADLILDAEQALRIRLEADARR